MQTLVTVNVLSHFFWAGLDIFPDRQRENEWNLQNTGTSSPNDNSVAHRVLFPSHRIWPPWAWVKLFDQRWVKLGPTSRPEDVKHLILGVDPLHERQNLASQTSDHAVDFGACMSFNICRCSTPKNHKSKSICIYIYICIYTQLHRTVTFRN